MRVCPLFEMQGRVACTTGVAELVPVGNRARLLSLPLFLKESKTKNNRKKHTDIKATQLLVILSVYSMLTLFVATRLWYKNSPPPSYIMPGPLLLGQLRAMCPCPPHPWQVKSPPLGRGGPPSPCSLFKGQSIAQWPSCPQRRHAVRDSGWPFGPTIPPPGPPGPPRPPMKPPPPRPPPPRPVFCGGGGLGEMEGQDLFFGGCRPPQNQTEKHNTTRHTSQHPPPKNPPRPPPPPTMPPGGPRGASVVCWSRMLARTDSALRQLGPTAATVLGVWGGSFRVRVAVGWG